MRDLNCPKCGAHLTFENSVCLTCTSAVGLDLEAREFVLVSADGVALKDEGKAMCANLHIAECNWLAAAGAPGGLCRSCSLTRTRPADSDLVALPEFAEAEAAKRRLVFELTELGLPTIDRIADPVNGVAFDLLSSQHEQVLTGHDSGVITLDLAESDDVHRERLRVSMDEPYRTLLGHFRHEIGHYYDMLLAQSSEQARERYGELFGDYEADYQVALDRHYREGAPEGWEESYISSYATMHPTEDFAETFAHYLHIRDTIDTAAAFSFAPAGATVDKPLPGRPGFERIIEIWLPLAWALNMMNRSMGHSDLYPFVLPENVLEKMSFIHDLVITTDSH